jgi:quinolinate synthase
MKMITLPKVLRALRDDVHEVTVPVPVAARARRALERMVSLG